jgi:hypothetical protein
MQVITVDRCSVSEKPGFKVAIPENCFVKCDPKDLDNGSSKIKVYRSSDNLYVGYVSRVTQMYVSLCPECDGSSTVKQNAPASVNPTVELAATAGTNAVKKTVKVSIWSKIWAAIKKIFGK